MDFAPQSRDAQIADEAAIVRACHIGYENGAIFLADVTCPLQPLGEPAALRHYTVVLEVKQNLCWNKEGK